MDSYRVDVHPILEVLGADVSVSGEVVLDRLVLGPDEFELTGPVRFDITVSNAGAGLVARGIATAAARVACARCLEPFEIELTGDVEGFYVGAGHDEDLPEEQDVEPIGADGTVDVLPAIVSALAVDAPFAPLHDPECAGLCPVCGCDRNVEECTCDAGVDERSPFAALKGMAPPKD